MMKLKCQYDYDKKTATDSIKAVGEKKVFEVQLKEEKTNDLLIWWPGLVALLAAFMFNRFRVTQKQKAIIELQKN